MPETTAKPTASERLDAIEKDFETLKDRLLRHFGWEFTHPEDEVGQTAEGLATMLAAQTPVIAENVSPNALAAPIVLERTLDELHEEARELDIPGRSSMNKAELESAIAVARGDVVPAGSEA